MLMLNQLSLSKSIKHSSFCTVSYANDVRQLQPYGRTVIVNETSENIFCLVVWKGIKPIDFLVATDANALPVQCNINSTSFISVNFPYFAATKRRIPRK